METEAKQGVKWFQSRIENRVTSRRQTENGTRLCRTSRRGQDDPCSEPGPVHSVAPLSPVPGVPNPPLAPSLPSSSSRVEVVTELQAYPPPSLSHPSSPQPNAHPSPSQSLVLIEDPLPVGRLSSQTCPALTSLQKPFQVSCLWKWKC